jgi:hypothetical protein
MRRLAVDLGSVEALEALLVLRRAPDRAMCAEEIARELHVRANIETNLERLAVLKLLDVSIRSKVRYRYAPATQELDDDVAALAREWGARRSAVLDLMRSV